MIIYINVLGISSLDASIVGAESVEVSRGFFLIEHKTRLVGEAGSCE